MKYRYRNDSEMKDSGVEWIGKIPKDWDVKKNKYLLYEMNLKKNNNNDDENLLSVSEYYGVALRREKISEDEFLTKAESLDGYKICKKDDLVMNIMLAWKKAMGVSKYDGIVSPAYCVYRSKNNIFMKYYHYLFRTDLYANVFKRYSTGIIDSRLRLYPEKFLLLSSHMPLVKQQEKIANFLDEKTSQFDSIISKKEQLIKKLEEAKKSLISEVVTGKVKVVKTDDGYDLVKRSSDDMKDSGVEWLGEIPKDWEVKRLKHIGTINPPKSLVKRFVQDNIEVSFVPMDSVRLGYINLNKSKRISEVIDGYTLFEEDDIIMAKVTPCFENRNIAICKGLKNKIGFGSSELNTIRLYDKNDILFMFYHLQEQLFMDFATYEMTGAGGLKRVPTSFLLSAQFAYPSSYEKDLIVSYLENQIGTVDSIIIKTKLQIEKLKESKQSLISEAVTGKIEILD